MQNNIFSKLPVTVLSGFFDCLVSENDLLKGEGFWTTMEDPFSPWNEMN
jgi:hypothetical protein